MAGRFLTVAAIAVIALLAGLWFLMNDSDDPASASPSKKPAPVAVAPTKPPEVVEPATKRTITPPVVLKRPTHEPTPTPGTSGTPTPELTSDAPAKPATITESLQEQVLLTETQVLECNEKALKAGVRLEGEAAFGYTIARKNGKIVVESTGVEYTAFDGPTSDCFRETAHAMAFDTLPEGVDALTAYRKVVFHDGALKRQWMTTFNVTRPPPPPPAP